MIRDPLVPPDLQVQRLNPADRALRPQPVERARQPLPAPMIIRANPGLTPIEYLYRLIQPNDLEIDTLMDQEGWRSDARVYAQCISRYLLLAGRNSESRYWSHIASLLNARREDFRHTAERLLNDNHDNQRDFGETFGAMIVDLRAQLGRGMWACR